MADAVKAEEIVPEIETQFDTVLGPPPSYEKSVASEPEEGERLLVLPEQAPEHSGSSGESSSLEPRNRGTLQPLEIIHSVSEARQTDTVDGAQTSSRMGEGQGGLLCCGLVVVSIAALLVVILVPLSFGDLEYYEMGFVKKKSTGKVDRSKVYMGGRHFIGVDATFKKFRADAHLEVYYKMTVFNKEKLQVTMTCSLQYFLIPDELHLLHDTYDLAYAPILRKTASSAIKNAATKFTVDQFRQERSKVASALFEAARIALGGTCCPKDCRKFRCYSGCKRYGTCKQSDKGLFAFVKSFQLEEVDITDEQEKRFLQKVIEQEKQDTVKYKQQEKIERKKTEEMKINIENQALEVSQKATASAGYINAKANALSKAVVEDARNSGLKIIYTAVNITKEENKKSLDYIRTLRNKKNVSLYVGFKTLVAKEGTA